MPDLNFRQIVGTKFCFAIKQRRFAFFGNPGCFSHLAVQWGLVGAHQSDFPVKSLHEAIVVGFRVPPQDAILLILVWISLLFPLEEKHVFKQPFIPTPGALADVNRPLSLLLTEVTQDLVANSFTAAAYALAFVADARIAAASATASL